MSRKRNVFFQHCYSFNLFLSLIACLSVGNPLLSQRNCTILSDQDQIVLQASCNGTANLCTAVELDKVELFRFFNNDSMLMSDAVCQFDTLGYYSAISSTVLSRNFAPFFVNRWEVDDAVFSAEFLSLSDLLDSLNTWDIGGDWFYDNSQSRIVGGNSEKTYGDLRIDILVASTSIVSAYTREFTPNNVALTLPAGSHLLTAYDLVSLCRDTARVEVVCTTIDTVAVTVNIGESRKLCLDQSELVGTVAKLHTPTVNHSLFAIESTVDQCLQITGFQSGMTDALVVACDEYGICDTTVLIVAVRRKPPKLRQTAILEGDFGVFCINRGELAFPGNIERFESTCEQASTQNASFELDADRLCVNYQGLRVGKDSLCLLICDEFDNCDTLNFRLTVVEPTHVFDTILVRFDTVIYCFDQNDFESTTIFMQERCAAPILRQNISLDIDPKTLCIQYTGLSAGTDSTCILLIDEFGNASITIFNITVKQPQLGILTDSLFVNETKTLCLPQNELPGKPQNLFNICPRLSGERVDFFVVDSLCIEVTGLDIGQEEACFVLCDDLGFCDTTNVSIKVLPYDQLPIAEDDIATTNQNTTINIPVLDNDQTLGGVRFLSIAKSPQFGRALVNSNTSITYFPDQSSCSGDDSFTYTICNNVGCDNAVVTVEIACETVKIFTAMSPNGDGFNDTFFIGNIEAHPNNHLQIYNRWGNLVYEDFGYENDWNGNWNGKLLPDGTYFYLLTVEENGTEKVYRGQVELHR